MASRPSGRGLASVLGARENHRDNLNKGVTCPQCVLKGDVILSHRVICPCLKLSHVFCHKFGINSLSKERLWSCILQIPLEPRLVGA